MKDNKDKQYYLTVKNTFTGKYEKVYVTRELYLTYKNFDRAEKKRKQRIWRCKIPREGFSDRQKSFLKRCDKKCSKCPYGEQVKDSVVSLDALRDQNAEIEDYTYDPASVTAEQSRSDYEKSRLSSALYHLSKQQREIVTLIMYEGLTQKQVAERLHLSRNTVKTQYARALEKLKNFLKNF